MIQDKIKQTIEKQNLIHPGEHVIIGLSGGPDSVCLFHMLKNLREERNFMLYAVHVNHGLRPGAAQEDQKYVETLCKEEKICCFSFEYNCTKIAKEQGLSPEEAGRKLRYKSFVQVALELSQKGISDAKIKIAIAQNANDQAETLLLRILRGTGPDGLMGIPYRRKEQGFDVIRPLLDVKRIDIEDYCKKQNLKPRRDQTNTKAIYTRNKIRLELIPYLEKNFNQNTIDALCRLSKIAAEDREYLQQQAQQEYQWARNASGSFDVKKLTSLPEALRHRIVLKAFENIGLIQDITTAHLQAGDRLIKENLTSKTLHFPQNYAMTISYGTVFFHKIGEGCQDPIPTIEMFAHFRLPGETISPYCAVFDWDKLKEGYDTPVFSLRTRRQGDYISLNVGQKKIQDYLVDQKIPAEQRDRIPMLAIGSEILWIIDYSTNGFPRHRYSWLYKVDKATKKAIVLETICET